MEKQKGGSFHIFSGEKLPLIMILKETALLYGCSRSTWLPNHMAVHTFLPFCLLQTFFFFFGIFRKSSVKYLLLYRSVLEKAYNLFHKLRNVLLIALFWFFQFASFSSFGLLRMERTLVIFEVRDI